MKRKDRTVYSYISLAAKNANDAKIFNHKIH